MANNKSALKRIKTNERNRIQNKRANTPKQHARSFIDHFSIILHSAIWVCGFNIRSLDVENNALELIASSN